MIRAEISLIRDSETPAACDLFLPRIGGAFIQNGTYFRLNWNMRIGEKVPKISFPCKYSEQSTILKENPHDT